jgi:hypothetical protein
MFDSLATSAPSGITLGDRVFTQPMRFPSMLIPPLPGLYAILVKDNGLFGSLMRPVYIGESEDLKKRLTVAHEKCDDWKREAAGRELYYALHTPVGMLNDQQRRAAERDLIDRLQPPCNIKGSFWDEVGSIFSKQF